jgi:hypothetical protein
MLCLSMQVSEESAYVKQQQLWLNNVVHQYVKVANGGKIRLRLASHSEQYVPTGGFALLISSNCRPLQNNMCDMW